uniref:Uncharacterized protein n=1 Tax=Parascaris equorum TaxID=6256 RepID=A0A914RMS8_PAREQ
MRNCANLLFLEKRAREEKLKRKRAALRQMKRELIE